MKHITPDATKNESGLIQMITMGKPIRPYRHKWVKPRQSVKRR